MLGSFFYNLMLEIVVLCDKVYPPSTVPSPLTVKNKLIAFQEAM